MENIVESYKRDGFENEAAAYDLLAQKCEERILFAEKMELAKKAEEEIEIGAQPSVSFEDVDYIIGMLSTDIAVRPENKENMLRSGETVTGSYYSRDLSVKRWYLKQMIKESYN